MTAQETQAAENLAHEVAHEAHEFSNILELLSEHFHHSAFFKFLHQWENLFFSGVILTIICTFLLLAARRYTLVPGGFRNFAEALVEGIENLLSGSWAKADANMFLFSARFSFIFS